MAEFRYQDRPGRVECAIMLALPQPGNWRMKQLYRNCPVHWAGFQTRSAEVPVPRLQSERLSNAPFSRLYSF
jgi:hypothetical protein